MSSPRYRKLVGQPTLRALATAADAATRSVARARINRAIVDAALASVSDLRLLVDDLERAIDRPLAAEVFASRRNTPCMACERPIRVGDVIAWVAPRRALCAACAAPTVDALERGVVH